MVGSRDYRCDPVATANRKRIAMRARRETPSAPARCGIAVSELKNQVKVHHDCRGVHKGALIRIEIMLSSLIDRPFSFAWHKSSRAASFCKLIIARRAIVRGNRSMEWEYRAAALWVARAIDANPQSILSAQSLSATHTTSVGSANK